MDPVRRIGVSPLDGLGALVVELYVAHQLSSEILDGGEYSASDDVPLDLGEPDLDLVQP